MWKYISLPALMLTACASAQQSPADAQTGAAEPVIITPAITPTNTTPAAPISNTRTPQQRFSAWQQDFIVRAINKGYDSAQVTRLISDAKLDPKVLEDNSNQAEFVKPIWSYVQTAASAARLNKGRTKLGAHNALFDTIEDRYGVDRHILTGIWGLESSFGDVQGNYDAISALASFAFEGRRKAFGEAQLFAILDLLKAGDVRESQLKSSWAGAMGMTQFIPATFRDYAVDFNGDGNKDLWGSEADALGSAANYLSRFGWRANEPVFAEVKLPAGFDYSLADGQNRFISVWRDLGVLPYHGGNFADNGLMMEAKLYVPAGANGPKLLTFKNFDVIKRYNNSNSYAMGIATLGLNLSGKQGITAPWPEGDTALSRTQKTQLQTALTQLGFDTKGIDGQIGPNSIRAIRAWQSANGVIPDGYVESKLYTRIVTQAGLTP